MISHPQRRFNPLSGEWVLVSPQRTQRPWQGAAEEAPVELQPRHDPTCYLCPGNARAAGQHNPDYRGPYVFDNDFPALSAAPAPADAAARHPLLRSQGVAGTCRVLCFSERHDLSLPQLSRDGIGAVIATWIAQQRELSARYEWVQIFENKGAAMGCSNPHPHGQIWASDQLPHLPEREHFQQREHWNLEGTSLLAQYLVEEERRAQRLVCANDEWVVLVPYWAVWPYETLLLPRRPTPSLAHLHASQCVTLATILKELLGRYDRLMSAPFPYSMGWHGAPTSAHSSPFWQLHAHFFPPLLRSASVRKFMVGYEMLAEPQRDLTPEAAARQLRELPPA